MQPATVGEIGELGTARVAVGEDDVIVGRRLDRGKKLMLRDRDGHLVVAAFDTEVPGEATASTEAGDGGAGVPQKVRVGVPAHHRMVVAVRLRNDGGAGQRRQ